ncbi:MAG: hypothetical protein ACXACP_08745 [Candidatus Hodarchaeales archaeon]|jgi:hypothetical protein
MELNYKNVDDYLEEVGKYLNSLPDRKQIIKELQAHIWDLAQQISKKEKGLTVQESFEQALMIMEDPKTLADKFLEEDSKIESDWKTPVTRPESKIRQEQLVVLAMAGFIGMTVIAWLIQLSTNNPIISILSFGIGLIGIAFFIMAIYITDEKTFKDQMLKMRASFQKSYDDIRAEIDRRSPKHGVKKPSKKSFDVFYEKEEQKKKEPGFWSSFGPHLGGFFEGVFTALTLAFFIYLEVSGVSVFNENWYAVSGFALYVSLTVGIAYSAFTVIFGRIRYTRLASALKNIIASAAGVILLVYYPFTVFTAFQLYAPADLLANPDIYNLISYADVIVPAIIGLAAVISCLSAIYDVFKFGVWKESDRRSLI